ncbi:MAG: hypothetical protein QOE86_1117 [Solirubrobacteraceae bacterium]|nr:hypothetical protein [Solirubrobacteraceae bacterium]
MRSDDRAGVGLEPPQPASSAAAAAAAASALSVGVGVLVGVADRGVVVLGRDRGRRVGGLAGAGVVVLVVVVTGIVLHAGHAARARPVRKRNRARLS